LYYKQDLSRSCCPYYTIRLDAAVFRAKKDQRQANHRWNRYVLGHDYIRKESLLCPKTREQKRTRRDKFDLKDTVHASEYSFLSRPESSRTGKRIEPTHKLAVNLESDSFSTEKFDVFLRYQKKIHNEDESRWKHSSFERFLCSGLSRKTVRTNGKTQKLGSYHQCYRLDGKLIAVGVLDLLPQAVSSVYLFYDPDFQQFEFGKLSALREIALAIEGQYKFYYMGFYIHSCAKMRYKAAFQPTYILDPESLKWTLFDEDHRNQLDKTPYFSVSRGSLAPTSSSDESETLSSQKSSSKDGEATSTPLGSTDEFPDIEIDPDESGESDTEIPEGSLFDKHMPGVVSRNELESMDLDHWKLRVRDTFVDLEVSGSCVHLWTLS
jgi:arginine-tRNA-protein transferase